MQRCPTSTAAEVADLRRDGIEPTLDELAALMHWGALVECPAGRVGPQPEDAPVEVGERVLWPLTMAADAWLDTARRWLPDGMLPAAYGLAAERARDPGAFAGLYTRRAALDAVTQWGSAFPATTGELLRALARIVPELRPTDAEPPEDDGEGPPLIPPQFDLADLVAETGLPLEYWQAHTSRHCLAVMAALSARAAAEGGQAPPDPSREAYKQLLCVVGQIRRRATCQPKS